MIIPCIVCLARHYILLTITTIVILLLVIIIQWFTKVTLLLILPAGSSEPHKGLSALVIIFDKIITMKSNQNYNNEK
jgi:hypothetical protein